MSSKRSPHLKFGLIIAALAFILDQLSKWIVITPLSLEAKRVIDILPFFRLTWAENTGISLSLFADGGATMRWVLVAVTAAVASAVLIWMTREKAKGDVFALALIFGGALGNIVDRVRFGYVVDFADLHFGDVRPFLIFNVADAAISIGVVILLVRAFLQSKERPEENVENA